MAKETIKTNKKINQAYLVLVAISFLSILIGGSYQSVWGKDYKVAIEVAEWVPPSPTPSGVEQDNPIEDIESDNPAEAIEPDMELDNEPDSELDSEPEEVVEPTKELAPMPTQAVKLTPTTGITPTISPLPSLAPSLTPSITPVITSQARSRGKVVPVNMSQFFAVMVVGMTSLKLLSIMIKRDRRKYYEQ